MATASPSYDPTATFEVEEEGAPHGFGNQPHPAAGPAIAAIKRFVAAQVGR